MVEVEVGVDEFDDEHRVVIVDHFGRGHVVCVTTVVEMLVVEVLVEAHGVELDVDVVEDAAEVVHGVGSCSLWT